MVNKEETKETTEEGISKETRKAPEEKQKSDSLNVQINELKDKLLRKAAEFENYKKRRESEISSFYKYSNEKIILELLPILDDFERLNLSWNEKHDSEKYKEGIDLINEKMKKVLKQHGLTEMHSIGKPFDVNLHDAVLLVPRDDVEPNTVVDEIEKGYYLKDKVIKHAKVIVSSKSEDINAG